MVGGHDRELWLREHPPSKVRWQPPVFIFSGQRSSRSIRTDSGRQRSCNTRDRLFRPLSTERFGGNSPQPVRSYLPARGRGTTLGNSPLEDRSPSISLSSHPVVDHPEQVRGEPLGPARRG